jgi:integrase/recombinase XerC
VSQSVKLVKRKNRYYARYYDGSRPEGDRQCIRSLKTERKDVAERRVVERRKDFKEGRLNPWNPDDKSGELVTFHDAASRFLDSKSHLRPASVNEYRIALEGLDVKQNVLLRNLTGATLRRYVVRDRSVAVATRRKRYRHLKAFFRWAIREGYIESSPLDEVTPPKKEEKNPEYLTPEQLRRLVRCIEADYEMKAKADCAQPGQVLWLLDLIRLAVNTGMRLGELTSLRWGAIDFREGFIEVLSKPGEPTKSGSERRIPMTDEAEKVLRRLQEERDGHGPGEHVLKGLQRRPPQRPLRVPAIQALHPQSRARRAVQLPLAPAHVRLLARAARRVAAGGPGHSRALRSLNDRAIRPHGARCHKAGHQRARRLSTELLS